MMTTPTLTLLLGAVVTASRSSDAATVWSTVGKGLCAARKGTAARHDPCTCAGRPDGYRGGSCSPYDLHFGQQWCYVRPSCPGSTPSQAVYGLSWAACPPAANEGTATAVQPAYVACRPVTTLQECQARCESKELEGMCGGVSWGASEVCYFYVRSDYKGAFAHDYIQSGACTASVNLTRAEIIGVLPAAVTNPSTPPYDPRGECNSFFEDCDRSRLRSDCKCKGIVDEKGRGAACSSATPWCYVDPACPEAREDDFGRFVSDCPPAHSDGGDAEQKCYVRQTCRETRQKRGSWVPIASANVGQRVVYQSGSVFSQTVTDTRSLSRDIHDDFSFNFLVVSGSTGGDTSALLTKAHAVSFDTLSTTTVTEHFAAGTVWQWQFDMGSACGNATVFTRTTHWTAHSDTPPCCLPGLFTPDTGCMPASPTEPIYNLCTAAAVASPSAPACFGSAASRLHDGEWIPIGSSSAQQNITFRAGSSSASGAAPPPSPPTPTSHSSFTGFLPIYWNSGDTGWVPSEKISNASANMTFTRQSYQYSFGPGVVWQYQLRSISAPCSQATILGHDVRLTPSLAQRPKCIPGYEVDIDKPHGPCRGGAVAGGRGRDSDGTAPATLATSSPNSMTELLAAASKSAVRASACQCLGVVDYDGRGAKCDPNDLRDGGRKWCYVGVACPARIAIVDGGYIAYCPPATNHQVPQHPQQHIGEWVIVASSNALSQSATTFHGANHSSSTSATSQTSFDAFASLSVSFSFNVGGTTFSFGGDLIDVSTAAAGPVVSLYSNAIKSKYTAVPAEQTFGPGVVWQWQFRLNSTYDHLLVRGSDLRHTKSAEQPPCCLPGMERDVTNPHGECLPSADGVTYSMCNATRRAPPRADIKPVEPSSYPQRRGQCSKHFVDGDASCTLTACKASRGPTDCVPSGILTSECVCKAGYCIKNDVCVPEDSCYNFFGDFPTPAGKWVLLSSSNAERQSVTHYFGTARVSSHGTSQSWTDTLKLTLSVGFPFSMGSAGGGSLSLAVGASVAKSVVTSTSDAFSVTTNDTLTAEFGAGAVWQWLFSLPTNECGNATVFTTHLRVTPSPAEPPCCLPGYDADIRSPHGACAPSEDGVTYNACPHVRGNTANRTHVPVSRGSDRIATNSTTCVNTRQRGAWVAVASSNVGQSVGLSKGSSVTHSSQSASKHGFSVSLTISLSISVFTLSIGLSVASELTDSLADTFEVGRKVSVVQDFPAGVVWQWQYDVENSCGNGTIYTQTTRVTSTSTEPPCCLPGHFASDGEASRCIASSDGKTYDLCAAGTAPGRGLLEDGGAEASSYDDGSYGGDGDEPPPPSRRDPACACLDAQDLLGRGARCDPRWTSYGHEYCYTSRECPYAEAAGEQYLSFCEPYGPAFNLPPPPPPSQPPAPQMCDVPVRQQAQWVPLSSASTPQRVTYSTGAVAIGKTTVGEGSSGSIGLSLGVGMSFGPVHVSLSAAFGVDEAFTRTTAAAFEQSTGTTFGTSFGPGVVWQWQWFVQTACANHTAYAQDMRLTSSLEEPPCCLPGYEVDVASPHGWCRGTQKNVTVSTCPKFPGTLPVPAPPPPPKAPHSTWLTLGNGYCGTDDGLQPDFVLCPRVRTASDCQALCTGAFGGNCRGVNFATAAFAGFSFYGSEPAREGDCFVYVKGAAARLPHTCVAGAGGRPRGAIRTVQPPSSAAMGCYALEEDAVATGEWQPIMSSNSEQIVRYQYGTLHTTSAYNETDGSSSSSWSVGVTAFFVSLGLNGGSGSRLLNGHLSQSEGVASESFEDSLPAGVVWQWQLRLTSSLRDVILHGKHLRLTESLASPPCCLPGLEADAANPRSKCLATSAGPSQNLCSPTGAQPAPEAAGRSASLSWVDMGHGVCSNVERVQPAHYSCDGVESVLECTSLCQFSRHCSGVNFKNATGDCALYISPDAPIDDTPPAFASVCKRGVRWAQPTAIAGVSYGAVGTAAFEETSCYALLNCSALLNKTGEWVQVASSHGSGATSQVVSYQFGTEQGEATSRTREFSHAAHNSFAVGFGVGAFGLNLGVSGASAEHSVRIHRDAFYKTSSTSYVDTFGAGTVWQFQFRAATPCGSAIVRGKHLLVTPSSGEPPCCLPGMAVNLSRPHGPCRPSADGAVVDLCARPAARDAAKDALGVALA